MSFRAYLIIMCLVSVCAWISWLVVVHAIDPVTAGLLGFVLFYTTFGMAFLSTVTLLGTLVRVWRSKEGIVYRQVLTSLRQGCILTFLVLMACCLSAHGLFVWWALVLLLLSGGCLELVFMSTKEKQ